MEFDCTKDGKNIYFACREKAAKYNDLLNSRERAAQVTVVLKADNKAEASTYTTIQAIQDEQAETGSDAETPENDTKYISASEDELNWNNKDSDILLRIAMAEAEGEGTEGKALVMKVVLNRVENKEFPNSVEGVVFQQGQFEPVLDDGRYWNVEPDAECYKALYMVQCENWDDTEGAFLFGGIRQKKSKDCRKR